MENDSKWIIVRIDGKIAGISTDYRQLAAITAQLAQMYTFERNGSEGKDRRKNRRKRQEERNPYGEITATTVGFEDVWKLRQESRWEDLMLFGTDFQKKVWRKLWELTHPEDNTAAGTEDPQGHRLVSYSDFAELCQNRAGVRAVAHAIGLNPVSVIIPCHLVIPKESIDKINEIHKKAEDTIFKGDDLCLNSILSDNSIDFGEYGMGRRMKRDLILREFR